MKLEDLIDKQEILDIAKRHDTLPDAKGIALENSNILDFTDELLALLDERLATKELSNYRQD